VKNAFYNQAALGQDKNFLSGHCYGRVALSVLNAPITSTKYQIPAGLIPACPGVAETRACGGPRVSQGGGDDGFGTGTGGPDGSKQSVAGAPAFKNPPIPAQKLKYILKTTKYLRKSEETPNSNPANFLFSGDTLAHVSVRICPVYAHDAFYENFH